MNRPALEMPGMMLSTVSRYFNNILLSDECSSDVLEEIEDLFSRQYYFITCRKLYVELRKMNVCLRFFAS